MKKVTRYMAAVFAAALFGALLVGCSGQQGSSSASAEPEQLSTEELIAELEGISQNNDYKSVTMDMDGSVTMDLTSVLSGLADDGASDDGVEKEALEEAVEEAAEDAASDSSASSDDPDSSMSIPMSIRAKCDISTGTTKMHMTMNLFGEDMELYINGEDAVMVMGDEVVGATLEELGMTEYASIDSIMQSQGGDFSQYKDAVETIEKSVEGDDAVYKLVVDPAKFGTAADSLEALSQYGVGLDKMEVVYRVGADGKISGVDIDMQGTGFSSKITSTLYDYDATVVPEAPEPTASYSDMSDVLSDTADGDFDIDFDIDDEEASEEAKAA